MLCITMAMVDVDWTLNLLVTGNESFDSSVSVDIKTLQKSPSTGYKPPHSDFVQSLNDNEFASRLNARRSNSVRAVPYALADLQTATGNFAMGRLLGEGSLGRVYRAKYPDGKVCFTWLFNICILISFLKLSNTWSLVACRICNSLFDLLSTYSQFNNLVYCFHPTLCYFF